MRIAVRYADEFNLSSSSPDRAADRFARLDETARAAGRDPATLVHSAMVGVLVGRDAAEVDRRCSTILEQFGLAEAGMAWFEERRPRWIFGTPDERGTAARLRRPAWSGWCCRLLPWDLEMVDSGEVLLPPEPSRAPARLSRRAQGGGARRGLSATCASREAASARGSVGDPSPARGRGAR